MSCCSNAIHSYTMQSSFSSALCTPQDMCFFENEVIKFKDLCQQIFRSIFVSHPSPLPMPTINTSCKHITVLFIMLFFTNNTTENEWSPLSDSIRLYTQLVNLCCLELDWATWRHLSTLSTIFHIVVYERNTTASSIWSLEVSPIIIISPFVNVKSLSFIVNGTGYIIAIIASSQFPILLRFSTYSAIMRLAKVEELLYSLT